MTSCTRVAGAQIPVCDKSISYNKIEILKAIDWAKENSVDYLLTPEGSLSGYGQEWRDKEAELNAAIEEVLEHQKKCGVGLCFANLYHNRIEDRVECKDSINFYDKNGVWINRIDKRYVINGDAQSMEMVSKRDDEYLFDLPDTPHRVTGMICNDMWGWEMIHSPFLSQSILNSLMGQQDHGMAPDIIFHASNAYKVHKDKEKEVPEVSNVNMYHESHVRHTALQLSTCVVTVDSCVPWNWNGDLNSINDYLTPVPSGVVGPTGDYLTQAPRTGRQYFYYDIEFNRRLKDVPEFIEREEKYMIHPELPFHVR